MGMADKSAWGMGVTCGAGMQALGQPLLAAAAAVCNVAALVQPLALLGAPGGVADWLEPAPPGFGACTPTPGAQGDPGLSTAGSLSF